MSSYHEKNMKKFTVLLEVNPYTRLQSRILTNKTELSISGESLTIILGHTHPNPTSHISH